MADSLAIADVLERAANLIEPAGAWMRGAFSNGDRIAHGGPGAIARATCWCAEGAIAHVIGGSGWDGERWVLAHGDLFGFDADESLAMWNDEPGRRQHEVVARLRAVAVVAREMAA